MGRTCRWVGLLVLLCPVITVAEDIISQRSPLDVFGIQLRCLRSDDPGRLEVHFRATAKLAIRNLELRADNKPIGENRHILWADGRIEKLRPGDTGRLRARFWKHRAENLAVAYEYDGKTFISPIDLENAQSTCSISGLRLSADSGKLFVYVTQHSGQKIEVLKASVISGAACRVSRILNADFGSANVACIVFQPKELIRQGQRVTVRVDLSDNAKIFESTSVFSGFPIALDNAAAPPPNLELDKEPSARTAQPFPEGLKWTPGGVVLFNCPAHRGGSRKKAAVAILSRMVALQQDKVGQELPGVVGVCRTHILRTLQQFGGTGDALRVNMICPFLRRHPFRMPELPNTHPCQYLGDTAERMSAPGTWQAIIPAGGKEPAPSEQVLRFMVAYALASGTKGILYRGIPRKELRHAVALTNGHIQALKEYLSIAEPVQLASCDVPNVEARTLLAGDRGIVLFLIQHAIDEHTQWGRRQIHLLKSKPSSVKVDIRIPNGMTIKRIKDITGGGKAIKFQASNNGLIIVTPQLPVWSAYVLIAAEGVHSSTDRRSEPRGD